MLPLLLSLQAVKQHLSEASDNGAHGIPHPQARLGVKSGELFLLRVPSLLLVERATAAVLAETQKNKKQGEEIEKKKKVKKMTNDKKNEK